MENKKKGNFKVFLKKTLKRGAIIIGYVIALNVAALEDEDFIFGEEPNAL